MKCQSAVAILCDRWDDTFKNKNIGHLIRYHQCRGKKVVFISRRGGKVNSEEFPDVVSYVLPYNIPRRWALRVLVLFTLAKIALRENVSTVQWSYIGYYENILWPLLRVPFVLKSDSFGWQVSYRDTRARLLKMSESCAYAVFSETAYDAIFLETKLGLSPRLLQNPISDDFFSAELVPWRGRSHHLLITGRLVEEKNIEDSIRVLKIVQYKFPKTELHFIGTCPDNEYLARCKELAQSLGVYDSVRLHQRVDGQELYQQISNFRIALNTSVVEGVPNRFIDFIACRVFTVSYDVGLCRELLDEHSGIIVEENTPESAADHVLKFLSEQSERHPPKHKSTLLSVKSFGKILDRTL